MNTLAHLRHLIALLDDAIVDQLCARARFRLNAEIYSIPDAPPVSLNDVARQFNSTLTQAGRIQLLRVPYIQQLLPILCLPGSSGAQASCLSADTSLLDSLSRRLSLSIHVASNKLDDLPDDLQLAIQSRDPARIEQAITHPAVEEMVIARVTTRANKLSPRPDTPSAIARIYADWLIPLSRKIQVASLLSRQSCEDSVQS